MTRVVLSVLPLLAALSCSGGEQPAGEQPKPGGIERRDTLVIASQSDVGYLLSPVYETAEDGELLGLLSFPTVDSTFDCSLKKKPGLAKTWEWSEDGKTIKMELRDDITWEDGVKVTADDIAFTYEVVSDANVASPRLNSIERLTADGRPKIIDATHIEWQFTEAYDRDSQIAHISSISLIPKHKLKDADRKTLRGNELSKKPLSYGPFTLKEHVPNEKVVLEANDAFAGPADFQPKIKRIIYRIIPEYSTRLLELQSGKVDLMRSVNVEDADALKKSHPDIELRRRGWRSMDYVAWNLTNPLFQDVKVRKALAMATDTEAMIGKLLTSSDGSRFGRRSIGTVTPALCGVHNDDVKPLPFDLAAAKALLAEAGWTDTDADGFVDKDGKKFSFMLSTNSGNSRRQKASVLVQAALKDLGVEVNLENQESNTFFERLRKREYEAALAGWSAALFVDPSAIWHSDTPGKRYEFNFVNYSNPEVDALIDRGLQTADPAVASPIWKELQQKIYDDQPYLFLWWMDEIVAVDKRFQNLNPDALSGIGRPWEVEVPADKVKYAR